MREQEQITERKMTYNLDPKTAETVKKALEKHPFTAQVERAMEDDVARRFSLRETVKPQPEKEQQRRKQAMSRSNPTPEEQDEMDAKRRTEEREARDHGFIPRYEICQAMDAIASRYATTGTPEHDLITEVLRALADELS